MPPFPSWIRCASRCPTSKPGRSVDVSWSWVIWCLPPTSSCWSSEDRDTEPARRSSAIRRRGQPTRDGTRLLAGGLVMRSVATGALVVLPYLLVADAAPAPGLKPYTSAQLRGREQYVSNGCVYCHSQQPRAKESGPDAQRGW